MKITFLRHAQSLFNKWLISEKDCDITEEGKYQVCDLSGEYDVIVISCLRRTHQTLLESQIKGKRILLTDLCREKRTDICDFLPGEDEKDLESTDELKVRIELFKEYLRRETLPEEKVLVISHGDFIWTATGGEYPQNAEMRAWEF
jgi:broad specificity phosphatase PhoE